MSKKTIIFLLTLLLAFTCVGQALANSAECTFNGEVVKQGMAAKLINGKPMATLEYTAGKLGADYKADRKKKQVTIKYKDKTFQVKADTQYLKVNDRQTWIDTPAVWQDNQLFVGTYVFKRIFGVQANYDQKKNAFNIVANGLEVKADNNNISSKVNTTSRNSRFLKGEYKRDGNKDLLTFNLDKSTTITYVKRLPNPERLVIDFGNAEIGTVNPEIIVNSEFVKKVRIGQFNKTTTRVVIDLVKNTNYRINPNSASNNFTLEIGDNVTRQTFTPVSTPASSVHQQERIKDGIKGKKIVVDPGHGGNDPGAIGPNGVKEKNVVLGVGLELAELLRLAGAEVIMTRDSDYFIDLVPRADIANNLGADLFISVHANSAAAPAAGGSETYSYNRASTTYSAELAKCIQSRLVQGVGLTNRGARTANFSVLRNTVMPGVLVELAFISNPHEESMLADSNEQKKMAEAIFKGIADYCGE